MGEDPAAATTDTVQLVVPALPQYARVARVTGAIAARRLGFSYRRRADLRLAIDETMILLLGEEPGTGTLRIEYVLSGQDIAVEATGNAGGPRPADDPDAVARFERIVDDLVDGYEIEVVDDRTRVVLRMDGD